MKAHDDVDCCSRLGGHGGGAPAVVRPHGGRGVRAPYGEYWREMRKLSFVVELLSARRVRATSPAREAEVHQIIS
jgi:hypothetical protein